MINLKENLKLIAGLKSEIVWKWFAIISSIDRGSGREKALAELLVKVAAIFNCEWLIDEINNVVIYVPATPGCEDYPSICLQGHLDMVTVGQNGEKDFDTSTVKFLRENGKMRADRTTLGADNGLGVAIGLALLEGGVSHGPLELLFTVDEETGLNGATSLNPDWIKSKLLINLDSERWGEITLGCAGGRRIVTTVPITFSTDEKSEDLKFTIELADLPGGHSGVDIGKGRPNAILILARIILDLITRFPELRLLSFDGGTFSNAIPGQSRATLTFKSYSPELMDSIRLVVESEQIALREIPLEKEPKLTISEMEKIEDGRSYFADEFTLAFLGGLLKLPNGAIDMDEFDPTTVETSNNVAIVKTNEDGLEITTMYRSSAVDGLQKIEELSIGALQNLPGAKLSLGDEYPAWQPQDSSQLLELAKIVFDNLFNKELKRVVVHAGLECALFTKKWPDMQMISIGPTIEGGHSQDEYVEVETVDACYRWLLIVLAGLNEINA
ncbi:MAG: beta-Ala-His dipeptidase [Candidatus Falkowbacteria bacterium]|nr:beta-Ala-His dipeptidase [Candidatus Falkowbacteria bacterium]